MRPVGSHPDEALKHVRGAPMAKGTHASSKGKAPWGSPEERRRFTASQRRAEAWWSKERAIREKHSSQGDTPYGGAILRARLLAEKLRYSAAMLENGDGMDDVRASVAEGIDRMWRLFGHQGRHRHEDAAWEAVLWTVREAERLLRRPVADQSLPRVEGREGRLLLPRELSGSPFVGELRTPMEAADAAIHALGVDHSQPELAKRLDRTKLVGALNAWIARGEKVGRRGKAIGVDEALIALGVSAGLPTMTVDAMKKKRTRGGRPAAGQA